MKLEQAAELSAKEQFAEAKKIYQDLYEEYPNNPDIAPMILERLQEVTLEISNYEESRKYGNLLLNKFPDSREVEKTWNNIIASYMKEGDYSQALKEGQKIWPIFVSPREKAHLALFLARASVARKSPLDSFYWLTEGESLAKEGEVKEEISQEMSRTLRYLSENQVRTLLLEYHGKFPEILLERRLIEIKIDNGELDAASDAADKLIAQFPQHPLIPEIKELKQVIKEQYDVDPLVIGCLLPLTGRLQPYGRRLLRGLYLAQELYNLSTWESPIQLVVKDSSAESGVSEAIDELVHSHHVFAIIGPLSRKKVEEAAQKAQSLRVPILTLTQDEKVVDTGNYVFRFCITNRLQAELLASYAVFNMGLHSFAILYPEDNYGKLFYKLIATELSALPATLKGSASYSEKTIDFTQTMRNLFSNAGVPFPKRGEKDKPISVLSPPAFDALFLPDEAQKASLIASQLYYNDIVGIRVFGTNLWNTSSLEKQYAPYLEGAIFTAGFFAGSENTGTQQFVEQFEANYDEKPQYLEAQAYDALDLILAAKNKAKYQNRGSLRSSLLKVRGLSGATGEMTVLPSGEVYTKLFLLTIRHGKVSEIRVNREKLLKKRNEWLKKTGQRNARVE